MKVLVGYMGTFEASGIDSYLSRFMDDAEKEQLEFDFLTRATGPRANEVRAELKKRGHNVFVVSRNRHPFKQLSEMRRIIKNGDYDVAYFNISEAYNCIGILAAKIFGIKRIVTHSHSSGTEKRTWYSRILAKAANYVARPLLAFCSDGHFACSDKAARWLYPDSIYYNNDYVCVHNSIPTENYAFSESTRKRIRKKLGVEGCYVVGHVGRFSYPKNHRFLLRSFRKVLEKNSDARLVLIGDGYSFSKCKSYAKKLKIDDKVKFLGEVNNVGDYLCAFDIFVLPSRFEGYPFVGIEAQANGLQCIFSNKITRTVDVTNKSIFLGINSAKRWAKAILLNKKSGRGKPAKTPANKTEFSKLFEKCTGGRILLLPLLVKLLLVAHYALNITAFLNGFNYLLIPSFALLILFVVLDYRDFFERKIKRISVFLPLALFVASYILTFLIMKKYNVTGSLKVLAWTLLHLFFVFDSFYLKTKAALKKEVFIVSKFLVAVVSLLNLHNFILLVTRASYVSECYSGKLHRFGLSTWGRFYGNYYDANYASVASVACIVLSLYLFSKTRSLLGKIMILAAIALNLIYVYMCESRTGLVAIAAAGLAITVGQIVVRKKHGLLTALVGIAVTAILVLFAPKAIIESYNVSVTYFTPKSNTVALDLPKTEQDNDSKRGNSGSTALSNPSTEVPVSVPTIGRTDSKDDPSNQRFDIWKSVIDITKSKPITGVGFSNMLQYAQDKMPETFVAKTKFEASHSMALDVMVSQGIIGAVVAASFFAILLFHTLRYSFNKRSDDTFLFVPLFSIAAITLSTSFFVSQIFYINNITTFIFWLAIGYLACLTSKGDKYVHRY